MFKERTRLSATEMNSTMKPGIKMVITGAVMFVVGGFVLPVLIIVPLILKDDQGPQFKSPGSIEVEVKEPGRYYLWNDYCTIYDGKSYNRPEKLPDGLEIRIRDADGRPIQFVNGGVHTRTRSSSSSSGENAKSTVGYVEVAHPGKVTVQVTGGNEDRIFSFSRSELFRMFGLIAGAFIPSMVIGVAGFGLMAWGKAEFARANRNDHPNYAPISGTIARLLNAQPGDRTIIGGSPDRIAHEIANSSEETQLELSFSKALVHSGFSILGFFAICSLIGYSIRGPIHDALPAIVFLVILALVVTPVFAAFSLFMLGCRVSAAGLRPAAPSFYQRVLRWEDIETVNKSFGSPFYVAKSRGLFGGFCILPGRFLLKDPESLRNLIERYAPADNIVRKTLAPNPPGS